LLPFIFIFILIAISSGDVNIVLLPEVSIS